MRCLALADDLRSINVNIFFVCRNLPGNSLELINKANFKLIILPASEYRVTWQQDAEDTKCMISQTKPNVDWLIVDHYGLDEKWEKLMRPYVTNIMVIDDLANRQHDCDILLDQNYYKRYESRYDDLVSSKCIKLLGPEYILLRQEFKDIESLLRERTGKVHRLFIFFGSTDPSNQTVVVLNSLLELNLEYIVVDVVVGNSNQNKESIRLLCEKKTNIRLHCQINNMSELISKSDLGIGAGGSNMWERCLLGLPTITVVCAENQRIATEDVAEMGAIYSLGSAEKISIVDYKRAISMMLNDRDSIRTMGIKAKEIMSSEKNNKKSTAEHILNKK